MLPVDSLDFCHHLPAETVDAVIAWSEGLDPDFAQMTPTQRVKGIWWKRKTAENQDDMVPTVMKRHSCAKVCGIILPAGHAAHRAVRKAKSGDHFFVSMISLPIRGMRIVNLN